MIAAVVATLLMVPVAIIGLLFALLAGIPPLTLLGWGGLLPAPAGLVACWLVMFVPAAIYVALVLRH